MKKVSLDGIGITFVQRNSLCVMFVLERDYKRYLDVLAEYDFKTVSRCKLGDFLDMIKFGY